MIKIKYDKRPLVKCHSAGNGERKELSDEERGRIRGLRDVGNSIKDIAKRLKRSRTFVQAKLQLRQVKSTTSRPSLLTSCDLRRVVREAATGIYTSIKLTDKMELKCSTRTLCRILLGVDCLVYTNMVCTLPLTRENKKARHH